MGIYQKKRSLSDDESFFYEQKNNFVTTRTINKFEIVKKFKKLIQKGVVKKVFFTCNTWTLNYYQYTRSIHFSGLNSDFISNALRSFVVIKLHDLKISSKFVADSHNRLVTILKTTNIFDEKNFSKLEQLFETFGDEQKLLYSIISLEFLNFTELEISERYLQYFENAPKHKDRIRNLPDYRSTIIFDYLLNDYYQNLWVHPLTISQKYYYPIYLWWKVTRIIPVRVDEFLKVSPNFCRWSNQKGAFIIQIKRSKERHPRAIPPLEVITVTDDIYQMVNVYTELTTNYRTHPYLFYPLSHAQFRKHTDIISDTKHFTSEYLSRIIKNFYKDIVMRKYGFNLVPMSMYHTTSGNNIHLIKPGDTRHFAFVSLKLQGLDPLSIARLGGHSHIAAQNHYYSHFERFVSSHIAILSRRLKDFRDKNKRRLLIDYSGIQNTIIRSRRDHIITKEKGKPVENGYCYDLKNEIFPLNCCDYCIDCQYFKLNDADLPVLIKDFYDRSKKVSCEIETQIQTLRHIGENIQIDTKSLLADPNAKAKLKSTSRSLIAKVRSKAILDSYLKD